MTDSGLDYSTSTDSESVKSVPNESDTHQDSPPKKLPRLENRKGSNEAGKSRASLPKNRQQISQVMQHISKQLKGYDIDTNLSLRIIKASLEMQDTHLASKQKRGTAKKGTLQPPRIRETICKQFGISTPTYGKIISSYFPQDRRDRTVYVNGKHGCGRSGNSNEKATRIPRTRECQLLVQAFVRDKRNQRERVTGRQVLDFLLEKDILHIPVDASGSYVKKDFDSAYRNVRRFLETFGYQRGRRTGNW
jgi:hypothetical protein